VNNKTAAQQWSSGSKPVRVLLADPDESLHPVYRGPLFQEGFELVSAVSGLECVARMSECAPDLLVLEPQLPWGGGEGGLAVMGEVPQLAAVPVMVLTSCRDPRLLNAVSRFPVSDYQLKPLAADRLAIRLRAILAHPKLRFALAEQNGRLECSIARRTGGRIHDLRVETVDGRVIVRGRSDSHHVKQLALAAVLEAFEDSQSQAERVELDIEVAPIDGWQARRCALSEGRNESYSQEPAFANEPALVNEPALAKDN
jgi:DNA-binding response OmpR family regulator